MNVVAVYSTQTFILRAILWKNVSDEAWMWWAPGKPVGENHLHMWSSLLNMPRYMEVCTKKHSYAKLGRQLPCWFGPNWGDCSCVCGTVCQDRSDEGPNKRQETHHFFTAYNTYIYIYICVCVYIWMHPYRNMYNIYIYIHTVSSICTYVILNTCIFIYLLIYLCIYLCFYLFCFLNIFIYIYLCTNVVYIYIHTYIHTYVRTYIHT